MLRPHNHKNVIKPSFISSLKLVRREERRKALEEQVDVQKQLRRPWKNECNVQKMLRGRLERRCGKNGSKLRRMPSENRCDIFCQINASGATEERMPNSAPNFATHHVVVNDQHSSSVWRMRACYTMEVLCCDVPCHGRWVLKVFMAIMDIHGEKQETSELCKFHQVNKVNNDERNWPTGQTYRRCSNEKSTVDWFRVGADLEDLLQALAC